MFLVDAQANTAIAEFDPLVDGATLNLEELPSSLSIVATAAQGVDSVEFEADGAFVRVESVAPYALAGDSGGNYAAWDGMTPGVHSIVATGFSQDSAQGQAGPAFSITINVTSPSAPPETMAGDFDFARGDIIMLHYDHAPDKDDGHSAAADRSILETTFGCNGLQSQVIPVGGTYGTNANSYNSASEAVMDAVYNDASTCAIGWQDAHADWASVVSTEVQKWKVALDSASGAHIWVKEGGQSDLTADVVGQLLLEYSESVIKSRVHVVQHSNWNEDKTTSSDLAYVKDKTDYIRIKDANSYLNIQPNSNANTATINSFVAAATNHPIFGPGWVAAFNYYSTSHRLDFSDTGELMWILGLGNTAVPRMSYTGISIDAVRQQYLTP